MNWELLSLTIAKYCPDLMFIGFPMEREIMLSMQWWEKWEIPKTRKVRKCLKETKHKHDDDDDGDDDNDDDDDDNDDDTGVPSFSHDMMGAGSPVAAHCNQTLRSTGIIKPKLRISKSILIFVKTKVVNWKKTQFWIVKPRNHPTNQ